MLKKAVFTLAMLASAAKAETLICPVGGEPFEAPQAAACENAIGQTMLLMPLACPPAPLPQCPQNFLPMYKVFSADELLLLKPYMQSESYESNVDFSPYYLAYIVEKHLNGPDKQTPARLLLWGLWQDPSLIANDPEYMAALAYEIEPNLRPETPDESALMLAMLAFTQLLAADINLGHRYLARAESHAAPSAEVQTYIAAVRRCFSTPSAAHCSATAPIPQP